jgi:hypothetical protein
MELMGIFGPQREEVIGGWRNGLIRRVVPLLGIIALNKSRRVRCPRHATHIGETKTAYRVSVRKPEGKGQHGRHLCCAK